MKYIKFLISLLTNNFWWGGGLVGFDLHSSVIGLFVDSGDSSSGRIRGVLKRFIPFNSSFSGTSNGFALNRYRFLGLKYEKRFLLLAQKIRQIETRKTYAWTWKMMAENFPVHVLFF